MKLEMEINSILKEFHYISGFRISIHDTEFNEIYSFPAQLSPFCREMQKSSAVRKDCLANDAAAFEKVRSSGEVFLYQCKRGLYEAVAPIYHYGILSGYLMMGQVCASGDGGVKKIARSAAQITGDPALSQRLAKEVHAIERDKISSYITIMTIIAEHITSSNKLYSYNEKLPKLIKEYLNKNFAQKITLHILSQKFGCCNSTLTNCFKKEYKMTIMDYLCNVRMQQALQLLTKSRKSLKEISADCGFYDQNYFSRLFTSKYGCSPSEYRNNRT